MTDRYDRQIGLFGGPGQERIAAAHVVILGCGGLGIHIVQQLAYLGVCNWSIVDADTVENTNLNRLVTATADDIGQTKTTIASQLITAIQPNATITCIDAYYSPTAGIESQEQIANAIGNADLVIGCFDKEAPRVSATSDCATAGVPYIDVATEIHLTSDGPVAGGRVVTAHDGTGCLSCLNVLDHGELARERMPAAERQITDRIYGADAEHLHGSGPSVVTVNGVLASLAATEAMMLMTGLRPPVRQLTYRADRGNVGRNLDVGGANCDFCQKWRDHIEAA